MTKKYDDMTRDERLVFLGTAKRITTKQVWVLKEGETIESGWFGRLRGLNIGEIMPTEKQAIELVKSIRAEWLAEALSKGLL